MKKINLINSEKSDVRYELTTFPDGEVHIKFTEEIDHKCDYVIHCRITNSDELFVLGQVCDILNRHGVQFDIHIFYLMSMRMDRVMTFNEAFSLELVAGVINSFHARSVQILEAHSKRTFDLIKNSKPMLTSQFGKVVLVGDVVACYPDKGASERYATFHAETGHDAPSIILCKKRNLEEKGAIMSLDFERKIVDRHISEILLRDDLCDGGRTFVMAAELLRKEYPGVRLGIIITHLVNPRGLENLARNYDSIIVSDSYKDWTEEASKFPNVNVLKVADA